MYLLAKTYSASASVICCWPLVTHAIMLSTFSRWGWVDGHLELILLCFLLSSWNINKNAGKHDNYNNNNNSQNFNYQSISQSKCKYLMYDQKLARSQFSLSHGRVEGEQCCHSSTELMCSTPLACSACDRLNWLPATFWSHIKYLHLDWLINW